MGNTSILRSFPSRFSSLFFISLLVGCLWSGCRPQAPRNRPQMTKPTALKTNHASLAVILLLQKSRNQHTKHFTQKDGAKKNITSSIVINYQQPHLVCSISEAINPPPPTPAMRHGPLCLVSAACDVWSSPPSSWPQLRDWWWWWWWWWWWIIINYNPRKLTWFTWKGSPLEIRRFPSWKPSIFRFQPFVFGGVLLLLIMVKDDDPKLPRTRFSPKIPQNSALKVRSSHSPWCAKHPSQPFQPSCSWPSQNPKHPALLKNGRILFWEWGKAPG